LVAEFVDITFSQFLSVLKKTLEYQLHQLVQDKDWKYGLLGVEDTGNIKI